MTDSSYIFFELRIAPRKVRQHHDLQLLRLPQISKDTGFVTDERVETFRQHYSLSSQKGKRHHENISTETHRYGDGLGLALVSNSYPVWAGEVSLPEVQVSDVDARGSMAGARYTGDNQQYIGCSFSNTEQSVRYMFSEGQDWEVSRLHEHQSGIGSSG